MTQRNDDAAVDRLRKTFDKAIRTAVANNDEVEFVAIAAIGSAARAIAAAEGIGAARAVLLGLVAAIDLGLLNDQRTIGV